MKVTKKIQKSALRKLLYLLVILTTSGQLSQASERLRRESYTDCLNRAQRWIYLNTDVNYSGSVTRAGEYCVTEQASSSCLDPMKTYIYSNTSRSSLESAAFAIALCEKNVEVRCIKESADWFYRNTSDSRNQSIDRAIHQCSKKGSGYQDRDQDAIGSIVERPPVQPVRPQPPRNQPQLPTEPVRPTPPPVAPPQKPAPPPPVETGSPRSCQFFDRILEHGQSEEKTEEYENQNGIEYVRFKYTCTNGNLDMIRLHDPIF
jgi:hypothetical protein